MLLIYTTKITPRIRYIFYHIFFKMLNIQISLTDSVSNFVAFNSPKLSYSKKPLGNELFFSSCSLLFEQGIQNSLVKVFKWKKYPVFFNCMTQSLKKLILDSALITFL